jgi:RNase adaptor protein for sRNA GlmZ degradation
MYSLNGSAFFVLAISAALLVAAAIYLLSLTRASSAAGRRFVLVGIGCVGGAHHRRARFLSSLSLMPAASPPC